MRRPFPLGPQSGDECLLPRVALAIAGGGLRLRNVGERDILALVTVVSTLIGDSPPNSVLEGRINRRAGAYRASPAHLVAGVLIVLAVMVLPSMVPVNSTCCPA